MDRESYTMLIPPIQRKWGYINFIQNRLQNKENIRNKRFSSPRHNNNPYLYVPYNKALKYLRQNFDKFQGEIFFYMLNLSSF